MASRGNYVSEDMFGILVKLGEHEARSPKPKHAVFSIIKGRATLNFIHRQRTEDPITVNLEDKEAGLLSQLQDWLYTEY